MAQVQRLFVLLAAVVLALTAVKWVVMWRKVNAAVAAAREEVERRRECASALEHHGVDASSAEEYELDNNTR